MDVNGTRYHLLQGERDWRPYLDPATADGLFWEARRDQVTLKPELFRLPPRAEEIVYGPEHRRGADRDGYGHTYWIDASARSLRYRPAGAPRGEVFWSLAALGRGAPRGKPAGSFAAAQAPAEAFPATRLRGLAVTARHYLVAGTLEPAGVLAFDLHGGGPPRWLRWPDAVPFAPFDLAAAPCGGVWALDLPEIGSDPPRLWFLDSYLRVAGGPEVDIVPPRRDDFRPVGGLPRERPARDFPTGISLDLAAPLEDVIDPVAVLALTDGSVLVLERGEVGLDPRVHRLRRDQPSPSAALGAALDDLLQQPSPFLAHDFAFVPDKNPPPGETSGVLYVASAEGNQSFAFTLHAAGPDWRLEALGRYLPMRRYSGKALVETGDEAYYDLDDAWLPLTELPRPRYRTEGSVELGASGGEAGFDGKEPGCVWHRLLLDACVPPGDGVEVWSRAADDAAQLDQVQWRREPAPYLRHRGAERPFHRPFSDEERGHAGVGTWELLFQQAVGRYLQILVVLSGSGRSTPKLRALRLHYPRFSYQQRYLPATYRDEPSSASFLDRFLANVEGFYTELEGKIAAVETFFDHRTAPAEALDWLAGWLGAVLDQDWEEDRRRLFIAHAMDLYRRRGTPRGLIQAVRLAVDECPGEELFAEPAADRDPFTLRLVEQFRTRQLPGLLLGDLRQEVVPSRVAAETRWRPSQGGARLHEIYRAFLAALVGDPGAGESLLKELNERWETAYEDPRQILFSPLAPAAAAEAADWRRFLARGLGFPYAEPGAGAGELYRKFLVRRHGRIDRLNDAYGLAAADRLVSFAEAGLPPGNRLPADGPPLADWFNFASLALPVDRSAHRFTVLVPVGPEATQVERQRLRERVAAVVERERPAHTDFDVQLYWALFRVGAARLGLDTLLGEGSRFTALTLGAGYLGQGLLSQPHPWNVPHRYVTGRDTVGAKQLG